MNFLIGNQTQYWNKEMTFFNKEFLNDLFEILELILELMNNPRYVK